MKHCVATLAYLPLEIADRIIGLLEAPALKSLKSIINRTLQNAKRGDMMILRIY